MKLIDNVSERRTKETVIDTWTAALKIATPEKWKNSVEHCESLMRREFEEEGLTLESPPKRFIIRINNESEDSSDEEDEAEKLARAASAEKRRKDKLLERVGQ